MRAKQSSATQRVLKSVVGPALRTSLAALLTTAACNAEKPTPTPLIVPVNGTSAPIQPTGAVPYRPPIDVPINGPITRDPPGSALIPSSSTTAPMNIPPVGKPNIPDPGKVQPKPEIQKVGTTTKPPIPKVGTVLPPGIRGVVPVPPPPGIKVGIRMDPDDPKREEVERPTRLHRRATDPSGGVLRTGFVGGRTLT